METTTINIKEFKKEFKLKGNVKLLPIQMDDNLTQYNISFKNKDDVWNFIESVQKVATTKNFGYNGTNNSYAIIKTDKYNVHFNPPKAANGDSNWTSYKSGNFYISILFYN